MTKYLMILAALFALMACGSENDPINTGDSFAGLKWLPVSDLMNWQEATDYCAAMGARLPTINELRKIIINCPGSTYGGACQVSAPDCLDKGCISDSCNCDGSADSYSALGDGKNIRLWSSSTLTDYGALAWNVQFGTGLVNGIGKILNTQARCVR